MMMLSQDLRSGWKQLVRKPWSSLFAIATLAIAIGAITALFALANAILYAPMAGITEPDRQIEVGRMDTQRGGGLDTVSYPLYRALNAPSDNWTGIYGWAMTPVNLVIAKEPVRAFGFVVTENYFEVLGVRAVRGRVFSDAADSAPGKSPHAVISYAAWQSRFGGREDIIGRPVTVNGQSFQVIGVLDRAFKSQISLFAPDVFLPVSMQPSLRPMMGNVLELPRSSWMLLGGRLRPNATLAQANAELGARFAAFAKQHPDAYSEHSIAKAVPLRGLPDEIAGAVGVFGGVLQGLVALVLLIACVNVAGMMLARNEARLAELNVRAAMGAGRARLVRMLAIESGMLALIATVFGLVLAQVLLSLVRFDVLPTPVPLQFSASLSQTPLLFSIVIALAATVVFGLWPALRVVRARLGEQSRAFTGSRSRAREWLVIAQVAMTVVLLVASALFLRALERAHSVEIGFRVDQIYTADLDLEPSGYDLARQQQVAAQLADTLRATPGIESVGYGRVMPLEGSNMVLGALGDESLPESIRYAATNVISPDYLATLEIAVQGDSFGSQHRVDSEPVAIVNQALAKALFPEGDAIGQYVAYDGVSAGKLRIIGVAATTRNTSLSEVDAPFLYLPASQHDQSQFSLFVRSDLSAGEVEQRVHQAFARTDANLPKPTVHAFRDTVALSLTPQRVISGVAGALGAIGLLLATVGTYGLIAWFVASRTREIGVRLSMGATPERITRDVLNRGIRLGGIGLASGMVLAMLLSQLASGLVFGLVIGDALAFVAAGMVLTAAILLASWLPARRAALVMPAEALRSD